jgi:DNA-binding transcriptional MerR regulator
VILVKSKFSIKDLENLSGIKSHTIRIWEKRYNLLAPNRTNTNIRTYDLESLRKILNVSYLKNAGIKISTIASLTTEDIETQVRSLAVRNNKNDHAIQELKLSMINFDQFMFQRVYDSVLKEVGFSGVFYDLFIPFLEELGFLWQSKTINLEKVQYQKFKENENLYILFLPENEMHDLGLLFLNYELLKKGCRTVYLGASMVLEALPYFKNKGISPIYITYITVQPTEKETASFLKKFNRKVAQEDDVQLWLLGHLAQKIKIKDLSDNHKVFREISEVMDKIPQLVEA